MESLYQVGARVRLRSHHEEKGRIIEVREYSGGFHYLALIAGEENWYAEADLEAVPERQYRWENRDAFLRDLMIAKMQHPVADSLYAYRASRTLFEPYQFRPALKFLRHPEQRILIADEVGLGKTIEAAIIYLELKVRTDISRVLVLCPARLKAKWISELRNRFDEEFEDLSVEGLRRIFDQHERFGSVSFRAVASYEMLRREDVVQNFVQQQIPIDLLIADEAHYMRNSGTATYRLGTALTDLADAVIFLTATPLHLGNENLFHLMHLLLPGEYENAQWFEHQIRPNTHINRAAQLLAAGQWAAAVRELRLVENSILRNRFLKNPYYHEVLEALQHPVDDRPTRVRLQRDLLDLNTLSAVFTRTRKREVVNSAVRAPVTITVRFSPTEMAFYRGIIGHIRLQLRHSGSAVHTFAIIARERMAASCLPAVRQMFAESVHARQDTKAYLEASLFDLEDDGDELLTESTEELRHLSRAIGRHDTKFDLFKQTLDQALAEGEDSKALIFSFYRRTLTYLHRRLIDAGYVVEMIHGGVDLPDRQAIIERFRQDPTVRVLLSSEVGAEGLDFQFCDILMNYDLPWNPMQVEQRIGRLDRFGQKHKRIRIYNFFLADTIESRIFQRLFERIQIFKSSIGDLEDILGEQIRELSKTVFQKDLTPEEEIRLGEQAADRIIQRQRANEELEAQKDELLGQDAIFNQQINEAVSSGRFIHAEEVRALVETFLVIGFRHVEFTRDPEEPAYTLTIIPELSAYLLDFIRKNTAKRYTMGPRFKEAMGRSKQIALTFDSDLARERNLLEFITHQHVLTLAALDFWTRKHTEGAIPATHLTLDGQDGECGDGCFFIYALDERGLTLRRTLYPLIILDNGQFAAETSKVMLAQLQAPPKSRENAVDDMGRVQMSETLANSWIADKRDQMSLQANQRHKALLNIREASITASFEAKIRRAGQALQTATDPRIRRLYDGQIRNLSAQRDVKLDSLRANDSVSISHSLIAAGTIRLIAALEDAPPQPMMLEEPTVFEMTPATSSVSRIIPTTTMSPVQVEIETAQPVKKGNQGATEKPVIRSLPRRPSSIHNAPATRKSRIKKQATPAETNPIRWISNTIRRLFRKS